MGTASINAISQNCLTININPIELQDSVSGFFGTDTNNFAYPDTGPSFSIYDKLEEAFKLNKEDKERLIQNGRRLFENEFDMNSCFSQLDGIIHKIHPVKSYFNETTLFYVRILYYVRKLALNLPSSWKKVIKKIFQIN